MKEKDLYPKMQRWIKARHPVSGAYELKLARGPSIPFNALAEHQERALLQAKHGVVPYKIPDDSIGFKPFDIVVVVNVPAYVVIFWGTKGYVIDIDDWIQEREQCGRKSCTQKRASDIALYIL